MNHLTRLAAAAGAGLVLALTAQPALAAPPTFSGNSNGALVERGDFSYPDGTYEYSTGDPLTWRLLLHDQQSRSVHL